MHKVFIAIALLFVVAVAQAQHCGGTEAVCVPLGGNCTADNAVCAGGTYCHMYDAHNNTCVPFVSINGNCTDDNECENYDIGETYCINSTCQAVTFTGKLNEVCTNLRQCTPDFYCNNTIFPPTDGICGAYAAEGQSCEIIECAASLTCSFGTCTKPFATPVGGACDDFTDRYSFTCEPNLFCQQLNETNGVCTALNATASNAPCNVTTPCLNAFETCSCLHDATVCVLPQVVTPTQAKEFISLISCASKCNNPMNPSCCASQQCVFQELRFPDATAKDFELLECFGYENRCLSDGGLDTGKKIVIIVAAVMGGLIVVSLLVFFIKRRNRSEYRKL